MVSRLEGGTLNDKAMDVLIEVVQRRPPRAERLFSLEQMITRYRGLYEAIVASREPETTWNMVR